ncbi:hypothetical protein HHK36_013643 [Tetracentron sinense]|uniref:Uncharacterized protein n=1 Tax=Tetracentron sinense TaxID=13715 RepID=A0A834Z7H8_TETSI|nr:hypothetical protein HHK36_013643 [Tetracentron sinense]
MFLAFSHTVIGHGHRSRKNRSLSSRKLSVYSTRMEMLGDGFDFSSSAIFTYSVLLSSVCFSLQILFVLLSFGVPGTVEINLFEKKRKRYGSSRKMGEMMIQMEIVLQEEIGSKRSLPPLDLIVGTGTRVFSSPEEPLSSPEWVLCLRKSSEALGHEMLLFAPWKKKPKSQNSHRRKSQFGTLDGDNSFGYLHGVGGPIQ